MKKPPAWLLAAGDGIGLGLAVGFYLWILKRPHPANIAIFQTAQRGLLAGLPSLLSITIPAGLGVAALLTLTPASRMWRTRLSFGSCGLYLACLAAALGPPARMLGPVSALLGILALVVRDDAPQSGAVLVALHVGVFGTALAFFEQWAWYSAGWAPFLENLAALEALWLGR